MISLLASCVGSSSTVPASPDPQIQRLGCEIAQSAINDPAGAARIVSGFGPQVASLHAEFASEVARNLSERDLKTLARTPAPTSVKFSPTRPARPAPSNGTQTTSPRSTPAARA